MGFEGSERIVCRFLATLRMRRPSQLTIRFATPPGEQAQADWTEAGRYPLPVAARLACSSLPWCSVFSGSLH